MKGNKKTFFIILNLLILCGVWLWANYGRTLTAQDVGNLKELPEYKGSPYVTVNGDKVDYDKPFKKTYINLKELDSLGRCQAVECVLGKETMPTDKRESIGMVRPSGWPTKIGNAKYDFIDGKYLFNRCHLAGFQLTGLNADERNLITGTRYLNVDGMLPFEDRVADYIKVTGNHVYYKATPIFNGDELIARGVQIEAKSLEDNELEFNVYCFNVQPNVKIDYYTGESEKE